MLEWKHRGCSSARLRRSGRQNSARATWGCWQRLGGQLVLAVALLTGSAGLAEARNMLCDPQFSDCRAPLLQLIRNETRRIDVAFWYMTDARYVTELVKKFQSGVPVRVIVDTRANVGKPRNATILQQLKDAGIPMRNKKSGGILHWKMMLFDGQDVVEFSKANYSGESFVPIQPNVNWTDEAIFFTGDDQITNTFRTKFDGLWTATGNFENYANVGGTPRRAYPIYPLVSWMNFPPQEDFATRATNLYNKEPLAIDALVFRATANRQADAIIAARRRGVRVRLITDPSQYRNPTKLEHSYNVDRMYMAGVQIKHRHHQGLMHEALVILYGLGDVIFGSSNWSGASANYQNEHNFFYKPSVNLVLDSGVMFVDWFKNQFDRKWNNRNSANAFVPFVPLAPTEAIYKGPGNGATGLPTTVTLKWDGGKWAWKYDIYLSTSSTLTSEDKIGSDVFMSPIPQRLETFTVQNLRPGTTYYWRVVSKTMANKTNHAPIQSFTTAP